MCARFSTGKVALGLKDVCSNGFVLEAMVELGSSRTMNFALRSSQSAIPYTPAVVQLYELLHQPSLAVQVLMELDSLHATNAASRSL
jgi:hypothetical protein